MTELEKKQSGQVYDTRDPELRKLQNRAKDLMRQYNVLPAGDTKERNRLLEELFGTFGRNVRADLHRGVRHDRAGCKGLYGCPCS